jgi:hypothetical protein
MPLQSFLLVHDLILTMDELGIHLIKLLSQECDWIMYIVG